MLRERFLSIRAGEVQSRRLSDRTGIDRHTEVLTTTAGSHVILYLDDGDAIHILDIYHPKQNLAAVLPPDPKDP